MSSSLPKRSSTVLAAPAIPSPTGLGQTLKSLRESRRLSLGDVSARLKFSTRQLQSLENEDWQQLPTGLSLRGLVKNYARLLEADADALLSMLESQTGSMPPEPVVIQKSGRPAPSDLAIQGEPVSRPWGWFLVILVLLFVAGFYAIERGWIPESWLIFDWLKSLKQ